MLSRSQVAARRVPAALAPEIRPISPWDGFDLQQFIRELSAESRYSRFMMALRELPEDMLDSFLHPDPDREAVLVATSPANDIIGLAQYVADDAGDGAEVALVVADAWHRRGLGAKLLTALAKEAGENGIRHLHADMLADNYQMRGLAKKLGYQIAIGPALAKAYFARAIIPSSPHLPRPWRDRGPSSHSPRNSPHPTCSTG